MIRHLFAYGTLQHPDIVSHVIHRIPEAQAAVLNHFARFGIKNEDFPGITPCENSQTEGTLFLQVFDDEWMRLDEYESDLYERQPVQVMTSAGDTVQAEAYVIPPKNSHFLSKIPWNLKDYQP